MVTCVTNPSNVPERRTSLKARIESRTLAPPAESPYVGLMRAPASVIVITFAILALAAGCDKPTGSVRKAESITPEGTPALDLAAKPQILFQVFGDKEDAQIIPLAAVVGGAIRPIGLTDAGWHELDRTFFASGASFPLYRDDQEVGRATVSRGMWPTDSAPLYKLPGCSAVVPRASVKLTFDQQRTDPTIEFIASSEPLTSHPPFKGILASGSDVMKMGREFGHAVGKKADMDAAELDALDFHARQIVTGATDAPTLLVSFVDPNAGDLGGGAGHTAHLFVLADKGAGGAYEPSYRHAASGDAKTVEFQRLVDHLDVNGDGVDEIILEAWHYGADNDLVVLTFRNAQWHEVLRVKQSWCLDVKRAKD